MKRTVLKCEIAEPLMAADGVAGPADASTNGNARVAIEQRACARDGFRDYVLAGAKPRSAFRCGAELELFGYVGESHQRLGHLQIQFLLQALAPEADAHIFDGDIFAGAQQPDGGNLTVEPGGQLEYSSAPHLGLAQVERELISYLTRLRDGASSLGFQFLAIGFDPLRTIGEQRWFPKPRYDVMRPYLARKGERAWDMMTRTCATQVSLDFASTEDLARKFVLGNRLAPYVTAMFANSPFAHGQPSGFKSTRARTWLETDPDRCGVPQLAWSRGFNVDDFVEYALDVPMLFHRREGNYLDDFTGTRFRDYVNAVDLDGRELLADWADHLTTIFTEARIKQVVELRCMDCSNLPMVMAAQAFWKGLLYSENSLAEAERLIPDLSPAGMRDLQVAVTRDGLQARDDHGGVIGTAQELVRLAAAGLRSIAPDELRYLDILQQQVIDEQICSADILLRNWHGAWHGSMDCLFEYVRIA